MPKLTVEGYGTFEVANGKRLVLALAEEAGVDQLYACGGNCRCTTCRVEFVAGEPQQITQAEKDKLSEKGLTGVRLSCQILLNNDMHVRAISRLEGQWPGRCRLQAGCGNSSGTGVGGEDLIGAQ